jgi:hypothetical protein
MGSVGGEVGELEPAAAYSRSSARNWFLAAEAEIVSIL